MQSKELVLLANRQCAGLVLPMLEDLKSAPLVSPIAGSGNHAHWILGHLVFSEGRYLEMMQGISNPYQSHQASFGGGSKPDPQGTGYPPYDELLKQLQSMHEGYLAWLEGLTEADLDQVTQGIPPEFELYFGTWRQMLMMRALHWMNHRGQLADCRRAAGRPVLMV